MKSLKEFRPIIKLIKEDKKKLIIASIIIFASGICEIFTGYLNGRAVEEITKRIQWQNKNNIIVFYFWNNKSIIIDKICI